MRLYGAAVGELREVVVQPPSLRDEGAWVFMAAVFVLVCVAYTVAFERFGVTGRTGAPSTEVLPYQVLFRDLPSAQQRVFRALQEGALEALPRRAAGTDWPAVDALAADGIPPFAPDVLDKAGLQWTLRRSGLLWQYVGVPSAAPDAPAYLISIQEPDPVTGEKSVPGVVDEEHRLLPDGRLLHVTYWIGRTDGRPDPILDPALRGWKQIRVASPFEEMEKQMETLR